MCIKRASYIIWAIKLLPLASRSTGYYLAHVKGASLSHWSKWTNSVMGADTCQLAFCSHGDLLCCVCVRTLALQSLTNCSAPRWRSVTRR